ncbi:hypothetical protein [Microbulbifer taiwanensis]|uniref:hypothetical protein n=1 Tax=Microbulbifer taiwanensis TaxID=986746 RepID=UPI00361651FB
MRVQLLRQRDAGGGYRQQAGNLQGGAGVAGGVERVAVVQLRKQGAGECEGVLEIALQALGRIAGEGRLQQVVLPVPGESCNRSRDWRRVAAPACSRSSSGGMAAANFR